MLTLLWRRIPFSFLLFPLLVGILLCDALGETFLLGLPVYLVLLGSGLFAVLSGVRWKYPGLNNVFVSLLLISVGYALTSFTRAENELLMDVDEISGEWYVVDPAYGMNDYCRSYLAVNPDIPGYLIVKDYQQKKIPVPGQLVSLDNARLKRFSSRVLPGDFNYAQYLKNQHVYAYVTSGFYVTEKFHWSLRFMFDRWRSVLIRNFTRLDWTPQQQGFVQAVTLGDKSLLDEELLHAFRKTGMSHVLAVSGLHVGILYLLLMRISCLIKKKQQAAAFIILCLWVYALLVGLPVSVVRAVFMFSLMETGRLLRQDNNIYNALFASAFILLLVDPLKVYQVGFQLSYAAVLSIVFFFPRLRLWLPQGNYFSAKVFDLIALAFAAQIGTFPFVLYYFHAFPLYFLLGNVCLVPLVMVLVIGGIVMIPFSFIPDLANVLLFVMKPIANLLFMGTNGVAALPYAQIQDVVLNTQDLFLLLSCLLSWVFIWRFKQIVYACFFLFSLLLVEAYSLYSAYNNELRFYPFQEKGVEGVFVIGSRVRCKPCLFFRGDSIPLEQYAGFLNYIAVEPAALQVIHLDRKDELVVTDEEKEVFRY